MIRLQLNAAEKSPGRILAEAVKELFEQYSNDSVDVKVATTSRNAYKITWYYIDGLSWAAFHSLADGYFDQRAIENDELEYDTEYNPIYPSEARKKAREKKLSQPSPDDLMRSWEKTGKFRLFCLNFGFKLLKPVSITKQKEDVSGNSNARALAKLLNVDVRELSHHYVHFITAYVEQTVSEYQAKDSEWIIKCIDSLFRYGKVFVDGKKVHIDRADELRIGYDSELYNSMTKKGNRFTFRHYNYNGYGNVSYGSFDNPEETADFIESLINKYYPDFKGNYTLNIKDGIITITVP